MLSNERGWDDEVSSGVDPTNSSASLHEDRYIYIIAQKGGGGEVSGAPSVGRNER